MALRPRDGGTRADAAGHIGRADPPEIPREKLSGRPIYVTAFSGRRGAAPTPNNGALAREAGGPNPAGGLNSGNPAIS
jgi:hypothetical protein